MLVLVPFTVANLGMELGYNFGQCDEKLVGRF